jgi:transcriptional regulator with GAF, ATPase, and Fis domain
MGGQEKMKKRSKTVTKKTSKSARARAGQKSLQAEQKLENLKINYEVMSGTCEMIEQCSKEKKVFERMLNLIGKAVECSQASLFLLDKKTNRMEEVASVGRKVDLIDFVRFDKGKGLSAWVAKEKRPVLLSNLHRKRSGGTPRSFLAIPLTLNGEVFGVMNLSHTRAHAFEREEVKFLTRISVPVALSLERMFSRLELERLEKELRHEREQTAQLKEKLRHVESIIPTSRLLEGLNEKIRTPLSTIAENAQFLLNNLSTRQKEKSRQSGKSFNHEFKRSLKEIKTEVNQVARTTEKLLKRSATW